MYLILCVLLSKECFYINKIKFLFNAFGLHSRSFPHVSGFGKPGRIMTIKPRWLHFSLCFFLSSIPPQERFSLCLRRGFISYMTYALPSCFSEPSSSPPLLLLFYPHCKARSFIIILSSHSVLDASHCLRHHWLSALVVGIKKESERRNGNVHSFLVVLTTLFHLLQIYSVEWENEYA
jgi:hypothetical protein